MDYFNDVLTNFLGLECGSCAAVYAGTEISRMLSKILICVPKMNKGTTWGREMTSFSFLGEISF